jgi:hypothetical protein
MPGSSSSGQQNCCECCTACNYVTGLYGTGIDDGTAGSADGEGNTCLRDLYWDANGSPAKIIRAINQFGYGCSPTDALWISSVCDGSDDATVGGADGTEIVFTTEFEIAPGACLSRIVLSGQYSADNYVKAGGWKVNGVDQCHIYHGSFYNTLTLGCLAFEITHAQAQFVHGTNTVEITVKNGYYGVGDYGGPSGLRLEWACFDILDGYEEPSSSSRSSDCVTEPDDRDEP